MDLTFDKKIRLLELDDLRKAHTITPAEWSEYTSLVLAWRSEDRVKTVAEETNEVTEETREER